MLNKKTFLLYSHFLLFLPLFGQDLPQEIHQGDKDAQVLLDQISQVLEQDFFDRALTLLTEGEALFPEDFRFQMKRGDLYGDQELYSLALESYEKAEKLNPSHLELRKKIASTLGYLDRNLEALHYLELIYQEEPDNLDDLCWMYYKTHQAEKGIPLLEAALTEKFNRHLSLTLGTLYSDVNNAELCRRYYLDAIHDALDDQAHYFASVGYYNLSLAEQTFYNYEAAAEYASLSLEYMDRSGGHLALGQLYMQQLNFSKAEQEILDAVALDETPLSRLTLAEFYLQAGDPEASLEQLNMVNDRKDESWMYYYGINRNLFSLDLHQQYKDAFRALYHQKHIIKDRTVPGRIIQQFSIVRSGLQSLYHSVLFRVTALKEGRLQFDGGSLLRGSLTIASGTEGFPALAEKYYRKTWDIEGFEAAAPWYEMLIGRERKDFHLLRQAQNKFMTDWEVSPQEEILRELIFLHAPQNPRRRLLLIQLYELNPGGLIQYGLRLPVHVDFSGTGYPVFFKNKLKQALRNSGFSLYPNLDEPQILLKIHRSSEASFYTYSLSNSQDALLLSGSFEADGFDDWLGNMRRTVFQP